MKLVIFVVLCVFTFGSFSKEPTHHGELHKNAEGTLQIWDENTNKWWDIESFWIEYSNNNGGHNWGKREKYPEYSKVNEHDTLIIKTQSGICLMEFFHERWRRANDVRRWNKELNNYAGCPYVFE